MVSTKLTEDAGIDYPIICGAMYPVLIWNLSQLLQKEAALQYYNRCLQQWFMGITSQIRKRD